jgi:hypothetical protein
MPRVNDDDDSEVKEKLHGETGGRLGRGGCSHGLLLGYFGVEPSTWHAVDSAVKRFAAWYTVGL